MDEFAAFFRSLLEKMVDLIEPDEEQCESFWEAPKRYWKKGNQLLAMESRVGL